MPTYKELEALPPEAYLDPENFRTDWDKMHCPAREAERHEEGYKLGKSAVCVSLDYRGVWGASLRNGGQVTSYEGIGYHALTHAFLRGILASKCKLVVHRWQPNVKPGFHETVIVSGENAVTE